MSDERMRATRQNLLRSGRRLERVVKGVELLRRKREALVSELFKLARPAADARARIAEHTGRAWGALLGAYATHGMAGLRAMAWPPRDVRVDVRAGSVWGVVVSHLDAKPVLARTIAARGVAPQLTGPAAAQAATEFEQLAELLLEAAPHEMLIRRLGDALARTSRQVNTLERRVAPALRTRMAEVRRALEEREREERLRLKHLVRGRQR